MYFIKILLLLFFITKQTTFCATEETPHDIDFTNAIVDDNRKNINVYIHIRDIDNTLGYVTKSYNDVDWLTLERKNKKENKREKNNVLLSYEDVIKKLNIVVSKNKDINLAEYLLEGYKINEHGNFVSLLNMEDPTTFKLFLDDKEEDGVMCGVTELHFYFIKFKRKILFFNKEQEFLNNETKIINIKLNLDKSLFLNRLFNIDLFDIICKYNPYVENIDELYYKISEDSNKSEFKIIDLSSQEEAEDLAKNGIYAVDVLSYDKLKEQKKCCKCNKDPNRKYKKKKKGCCERDKFTSFEILKIDIK